MKFNYIRAHLSFLLNKKNIIILTIVNISIIVYSIITSNLFTKFELLDMNRMMYFENFIASFFNFIKILYVILMIYISSLYYSIEYRNYKSYFITNNKSNIIFQVTRIISNLLISLIELILIMIIYYFLMIILPYGSITFSSYKSFINLYILTIIYLFISIILNTIFKSNIIEIVIITIYFIGYVNSSFYVISDSMRIYVFIFPSLYGANNEFIYGLNNELLYCLILCFLSKITIYFFDN